MIEKIATWGAIGFALVAAVLWLFASRVNIRAAPVNPPGDPNHPNDMIWVDDTKGLQIVTQTGAEIVDVLETAPDGQVEALVVRHCRSPSRAVYQIPPGPPGRFR